MSAPYRFAFPLPGHTQGFAVVIVLLCILCSSPAYMRGQSRADSLLRVIREGKKDTSHIDALNALSNEFRKRKPDTALVLVNEALDLAKKIGYDKGTGDAYHQLGRLSEIKDDIPGAIAHYTTAAEIRTQAGDHKALFTTLTDLGYCYKEMGNYPMALKYHLLAFETSEQSGDKLLSARSLYNTGGVYKKIGDASGNDSARLGNYRMAMDYYKQALKIRNDSGDLAGQAVIYTGIGNIHLAQGRMARRDGDSVLAFSNYEEALSYQLQALDIDQQKNNSTRIALDLGNIANIYFEEAKSGYFDQQRDSLFAKALDYNLQALEIEEKNKDRREVATTLGNIGTIHATMKNFKEAESYFLQALAIDTAVNFLEHAFTVHNLLSELYAETGQWQKAYYHHNLYTSIRDSLVSAKNLKEIGRIEAGAEFEKQQAIKEAEHLKELEMAEAVAAEQKRQQMIIIFFIGSIAVAVTIIAIIILRSLRITRRQKVLIEEQKSLVETRNKEMLDSISYARRLQDAILPRDDYWFDNLPESFILYKPKDIVAGDFYWMETTNTSGGSKYILLAAGDCTGHGVPGALVSVVCCTALNRSVKEFSLSDPGKILDKTRELVIETFAKSGDEVKDGMDISLCALDVQSGILHWAGANNPLWVVRHGELIAYKPDKQPVGMSVSTKPFTTHRIELIPGDEFYMFTDGYADQFGGAKGKKFMYKQQQQLLIANAVLPVNEQKAKLDEAFEQWRGTLEQVDDICVIGVRYPAKQG